MRRFISDATSHLAHGAVLEVDEQHAVGQVFVQRADQVLQRREVDRARSRGERDAVAAAGERRRCRPRRKSRRKHIDIVVRRLAGRTAEEAAQQVGLAQHDKHERRRRQHGQVPLPARQPHLDRLINPQISKTRISLL